MLFESKYLLLIIIIHLIYIASFKIHNEALQKSHLTNTVAQFKIQVWPSYDVGCGSSKGTASMESWVLRACLEDGG